MVPSGGGSWLGWKTVEGRVINVDPVYMARQDFDWAKILLKWLLLITLLILVGPILIGAVIGVWIFAMVLSFLLPRRGDNSPGFISSALSHAVGFFFSKRLQKNSADVPVRDIRLRDAGGTEQLVRIKGEITAGSVNVGDDLEITGVNRGGTILFRRGRNKRINSEIRVRRR